LLDDDPHEPPRIAALHALDGHDLRRAVRPDQVDLGVTVTKGVNMYRRMVIGEDDDAKAFAR